MGTDTAGRGFHGTAESFPAEVQLQFLRRAGARGKGGELAVVTFIFGPVEKSFFSVAGSDTWVECRNVCSRAVRELPDQSGHYATVLAIFGYKDSQVAAVTKLDAGAEAGGASPPASDSLVRFWEDLPGQMAEVLGLVDSGDLRLTGAGALVKVLTSEGWTLRRRSEPLDARRYTGDDLPELGTI